MDEKKPDEKIQAIKTARDQRKVDAGPAAEGDTPGGKPSSPTRKPRVKRTTKKTRTAKYEDVLPVATFREYSDEALDTIPALLPVSKASEIQKKAIGSAGRNVLVKRLDNAENFDEIMLCVVLVPLVLKWSVECVRSFMAKPEKLETPKNEKPTHINTG